MCHFCLHYFSMKGVLTPCCVHRPVKILSVMHERNEWCLQVWTEYEDAKKYELEKLPLQKQDSDGASAVNHELAVEPYCCCAHLTTTSSSSRTAKKEVSSWSTQLPYYSMWKASSTNQLTMNGWCAILHKVTSLSEDTNTDAFHSRSQTFASIHVGKYCLFYGILPSETFLSTTQLLHT